MTGDGHVEGLPIRITKGVTKEIGKLTREDYGRDHHPRCFSIWLAGGGIRPGSTFGRTDDFSYNIVDGAVHVHDLQATLLHCLGIDHTRFTGRSGTFYGYEGLGCIYWHMVSKLLLATQEQEQRFRQEHEDCILCGLCVRMCEEQMMAKAIGFRGRGQNRSIGTPFDIRSEQCRLCGGCMYVCPACELSGACQLPATTNSASWCGPSTT